MDGSSSKGTKRSSKKCRLWGSIKRRKKGFTKINKENRCPNIMLVPKNCEKSAELLTNQEDVRPDDFLGSVPKNCEKSAELLTNQEDVRPDDFLGLVPKNCEKSAELLTNQEDVRPDDFLGSVPKNCEKSAELLTNQEDVRPDDFLGLVPKNCEKSAELLTNQEDVRPDDFLGSVPKNCEKSAELLTNQEDVRPDDFLGSVPKNCEKSAELLTNQEDVRPDDFLGNLSLTSTDSSLVVEEQEPEHNEISELTGQRLFDVKYLFDQLIAIDHRQFNCNFKDFKFIKERKLGFQSLFTFQCKMCGVTEIIKNEKNDSKINQSIVQGVVGSGSGFAQLEEFCGYINLPCMSEKTFIKENTALGELLKDVSVEVMIKAGLEEKNIAIEKGHIDSRGIPYIIVVTDGSWGKRSYRTTNYNSLSGVSCIIGFETKKVLFLGIRNSYCCICAIANKKNIEPKEHKCFKNWSGTSTAMEADGIVEGFKCSMEMHGLKFTEIIGDGDSSVTNALQEALPYGHTTVIKKIECSNHLLRNYCTKLRALTKKTENKFGSVPVLLRKKLDSNILRLRKAIKGAVQHTTELIEKSTDEKISILKEDIRNGPCHVFGEHTDCKRYFCKEKRINEENWVPRLKQCGLWYDIYTTISPILKNAESLLMHRNNNIAEQFNAIIAKFIGGKRINYSLRGSYESRCYAAATQCNTGSLLQTLTTRNDASEPKKYSETYVQRHKRKLQLNRSNGKRRTKRMKRIATADEHYGDLDKEADMDPDSYEISKEIFLKKLEKTPVEIEELQQKTVGQSSSSEWAQERKLRLTASTFGRICKLRATTSSKNVIQDLLYSTFKGNDATRYGNTNESTAIKEAQKLLGVNITPCGFYVDETSPFLGASPDGLIGNNTLVEVKCPASAASLTPEEAIDQKKIKFCQKDKNGKIILKRNHNYYFQVQGQMHITKRDFCYFVVWTPKGLIYEKINKDDGFWETNLIKLKDFYFKCLLPEIIDPRIPRKLPVRERT